MRVVFLMILFPCVAGYSQIDFSLNAGGGASLIYNSATVNMNHLYYGSPVRSIPKRSFETGISMRKYFENTFIEMGLSYSYVQSVHEENTFAQTTVTGQGMNQIYIEKFRTIGYLTIPIILSRNYESFSIGAGLQPQFTLHVTEDKKMWYGPSAGINLVDPVLDNRTIRTFDLGFVGQANLKATERLSLNFKLYWGITNINNFQEKGVMNEFFQIESPVIDRRLKNRQFIISLRYKLFSK